jgi:hypothetical protein
MDTAFVIGNGESRNIFPIDRLKDQGTVYGCNAIYRDHPELCDHIVAVNTDMHEEVMNWHNEGNPVKVHGRQDISDWNYVLDNDQIHHVPDGLKLYRIWRGGNAKKGGKIRSIDFSQSRGSGCSAVLMAAEHGHKTIIILAFDILGAQQWEMDTPSRIQNNIYKNTRNYDERVSMKAYLKYEWMFQLRQIIRKYPDIEFRYINRKEYLESNPFLRYYFDQPNVKVGIYADLMRWIEGNQNSIQWRRL